MPGKQIGIINEQGFVEGIGLGFDPINENELHKDSKKKDKDKNKESKTQD